jgi:Skp family chaperone for outer membrane proteins
MFMIIKRQPFTFYLTAVVVLCIGVGYAAVAASTHLRPPTVVVTFDIERVTDDLLERADAQRQLQELEIQIEDQGRARFDEMKRLQAALETVADVDSEVIEEQLELLTLEAYSFKQFAQMRFDSEKSLLFQNIYRKIKSSVEVVAEENGYDLVLISDSDREISTSPNQNISQEVQVLQQIKDQHVAYANPQIDITEQIVTYMNLEWEKRSE